MEAARWSRAGEFFNTACFQAQQAVEKALKAFLLARGERSLRGHSVLELLDRCVAFDASFARFRQDCRVLDRHYIPTRYPDALPEGTPHEAFGAEDADDAIRRAEGILKAVADSLGLSSPVPPVQSATDSEESGALAEDARENSAETPPADESERP